MVVVVLVAIHTRWNDTCENFSAVEDNPAVKCSVGGTKNAVYNYDSTTQTIRKYPSKAVADSWDPTAWTTTRSGISWPISASP